MRPTLWIIAVLAALPVSAQPAVAQPGLPNAARIADADWAELHPWHAPWGTWPYLWQPGRPLKPGETMPCWWVDVEGGSVRLFAFLEMYFDGRIDFNGDGLVNSQDFFDFMRECP